MREPSAEYSPWGPNDPPGGCESSRESTKPSHHLYSSCRNISQTQGPFNFQRRFREVAYVFFQLGFRPWNSYGSEFGDGNEGLYTAAQQASVEALLPDASAGGPSLAEMLEVAEVSAAAVSSD